MQCNNIMHYKQLELKMTLFSSKQKVNNCKFYINKPMLFMIKSSFMTNLVLNQIHPKIFFKYLDLKMTGTPRKSSLKACENFKLKSSMVPL